MTQAIELLTHAARRARRQALAEAVRATGGDVRGVGAQFGVSCGTVYESCKEFGITIPQYYNHAPFSSYKVIAALFDRKRTFVQIGKDHGVSAQRIGQIYRGCREAGVPVPVRSGRRKS